MKLVDIEKSFVDFIGPNNSWRTNIQSILEYDDKKYFLVKECRAELVGKNPFLRPERYEFLCIADNSENAHVISTSSVGPNKEILRSNVEKAVRLNITEREVRFINNERVAEILENNSPINIYCKISYDYDNQKYFITAKCSYINYSSDIKRTRYCQPIMGYVPFIYKNTLTFGYVVRYSEKDFYGNLEFLLIQQSDIFSGSYRNNIAKYSIGAILNKVFLRDKKKYDFTQYISLENSNIEFFCYQ